MSSNLRPGFIILHGNQLEQLRTVVFEWLGDNPLLPLEQEIFLVQSNGIAEWLKIALAQEAGICAASRITLPARFLWECYRATLGAEQVPRRSPLDKAPLTWRLMQLLPQLTSGPVKEELYQPLRNFLQDGDPERRLQLAQRLADLMDQYQVYRADWLADWADGQNLVRRGNGDPQPLAPDQRWQAQLWREVVASVPQEQRGTGRAEVHRKFVAALQRGEMPAARLPRRVVLFGISALPYQTLEALGALALHAQVVLAVPNPCRFYWGDIIDGRELLTAERRRQQLRAGQDLSAVPLEEMHAHSHPLLASWGRLGRDFIRMLDRFDDASTISSAFPKLQIDLFNEEPGQDLLSQVQSAIRDLLPLAEHAFGPPAEHDRSIEFHIAHSTQREVEILHDQLLGMLASQEGNPLRPRDIVVMVPDIEVFAPAIQAVFGQYQRGDARCIPFEVVDAAQRRGNPMLVALDWLLRLPQQRCLQSEVRDLLDVPAIASRFGLQESDLPRLGQWIEGSGVRWGLDREHRAGIGLGPAGEQNAWIFGIRRMLLGYANGCEAAFADIEPYPEIGGLDAALAGSLASFISALLEWRRLLEQPATPEQWAWRARDLLKSFFSLREEDDKLTAGRLEQALQCWIDDCAMAHFIEPVPLTVFREAWLGSFDEPSLQQRFMSGGVTFCTLMPMRAVPFRVVCLLGMNDGDYPRRTQRADFDLLSQPGLSRPGDRSRRDDDRYLMLEALLAARDKLYISWTGRNVRDNSEQPASVLVSQLRDYLAAGWQIDLSKITTEHPLQPFSRRYFEQDGLITYAREWRAAHAPAALPDKPAAAQLPPWQPEPGFRLTLQSLAEFVRQPVRYFFRHRLQVEFAERQLSGQDEEMFGPTQLDKYLFARHLLEDEDRQETVEQAENLLQQRAGRLARQGMLPIGLIGSQWCRQLVEELVPVRQAWLESCSKLSPIPKRIPVSLQHGGMRLEDWIGRLRSRNGEPAWLELEPGKLARDDKALRAEKLIEAWLRQLAAAAAGQKLTGYLVATDAMLELEPLDPDCARSTLELLMTWWRKGMQHPLPAACRTALEFIVQKGDDGKARRIYEGDRDFGPYGEVNDPCLSRLWPDYASLRTEPEWSAVVNDLYLPLQEWLDQSVRRITPAELDLVPGTGASGARDAA